MGSTPRHQSIERWTRKGCARCPAQSQAKNQTCRHPGTTGGLCPAPPAAVCLLLQRSRLKRSPGKGTFFPPRGGEEGVGEQPEDCFRFGSLPRISAARVHVSLSAGKGERNGEVSPPGGQSECASAPQTWPCPGPWRQRIWRSGRDSGRWRCRPAGTACQGALGRRRRELRAKEGAKARGRGAAGQGGRWSPQGPRSAARRPHTTSSSPWQRRQQP